MTKSLYDVYDQFGNKLISEKSASEIGVALCVPASRVTKCFYDRKLLEGKYYVEKVYNKLSKKEEEQMPILLSCEWEKAVAPFKNVEWVKEYIPGAKRLMVKAR